MNKSNDFFAYFLTQLKLFFIAIILNFFKYINLIDRSSLQHLLGHLIIILILHLSLYIHAIIKKNRQGLNVVLVSLPNDLDATFEEIKKAFPAQEFRY